MADPDPAPSRWPWFLSAMVHLLVVGLAATLWVSATPPSRAVTVVKLVPAAPPRPREVVPSRPGPPRPAPAPAPEDRQSVLVDSAPATEPPLPLLPEPTSDRPRTDASPPPESPAAVGPVVGPEPEPDYLSASQVTLAPRLPVDVLRARLRYPPAARRLGLESTVGLELLIDRSGAIRRIVVVQDPGHGFAEAAVKAFEGLACTPAQTDGVAVAVRYRVPVRFRLDQMP